MFPYTSLTIKLEKKKKHATKFNYINDKICEKMCYQAKIINTNMYYSILDIRKISNSEYSDLQNNN